jgi:release factor glutamine methyltransferase
VTRPADVVHDLAGRLAAAGFPSPGADARFLVAHAVGVDVSALLARWELTPEEVARARRFVARREAGEPVQHITGEAHFRYETLHVGPGVFIPRPETELLAGWAIDWLGARGVGSRRVVELCAGSGAISLSILRELGGVEAFVNERSREAEPYLRRNLEGLGACIEIGDMRDAFRRLDATVDLVVVNPPYVPTALRDRLPTDVVGHDPESALFGGEDGLDSIRDVVRVARRLLAPGGALAVEHDDSHQKQVLDVLRAAGFTDVRGHPDLTGRDRFATALWGPAEGEAVARWTP